MKSINFSYVVVLMLVASSSVYSLPAPAPEPQFEDFISALDIFGIFDSYEDYEFENQNVTSND